MHVNTFSSLNAVTEVYLRELERIRSALLNQLAQLDSQILVCRDFADPAVELPLAPEPSAEEPKPEVAAGTQTPATKPAPEGDDYKEPKFVEAWREEQRKPGGVVKTNAEGRPILKPEDLKRLETTIADG
jgi:hypothetical protein